MVNCRDLIGRQRAVENRNFVNDAVEDPVRRAGVSTANPIRVAPGKRAGGWVVGSVGLDAIHVEAEFLAGAANLAHGDNVVKLVQRYGCGREEIGGNAVRVANSKDDFARIRTWPANCHYLRAGATVVIECNNCLAIAGLAEIFEPGGDAETVGLGEIEGGHVAKIDPAADAVE